MKGNIYRIEGMHCASCATIIDKKLTKLDGVDSVSVNFATEKAVIEFDPEKVTVEKMNTELQQLGYSIANNVQDGVVSQGGGVNTESNQKRILDEYRAKTQFVLPVALFIFFVMMWELAAKTFASVPNLPMPMGLFNMLSLVIATITMFWVGQPFIQGVVRFVRFRVANMDTLIGIGTMTAYIYSAIIVLLPAVRELFGLPGYTYFDVVIVVIGFVTLGKYLETRSKQKTGEAIQKLLGLQAKTALVVRGGVEMEIPLAEVVVGDHIIVKPGGKIPVDGKILSGSTSIDEAMISGEPIPIDKQPGDLVIGATINKQGSIVFEATKVGEDTLLAQIIQMVENAQGSRAPIQALVDKISSVFVPIVLVIALTSLIAWLVIGIPALGLATALSYGILSFVGVLIIACPCALGLATPTAIIVGVGKGALHGILVKDAESLETLARVNTVVLDKTGTLTKGTPVVTDVVVIDSNYTEKDIILKAGSVEQMSEHPLATAVVSAAKAYGDALPPVEAFQAREGVGVEGRVAGVAVTVAKPKLSAPDARLSELEAMGKTVVVVSLGGKPVGYIALADTLKDEAKVAVANLHKLGVKVIMLTGDNARAASHIGEQAGIDQVIAEVLPSEKADTIETLKREGRIVAMVGDGINDAPALVAAQVGIAMATGTDIAIESAGITLLNGDLAKLSDSIKLGRATMRTVKQNLFFAFIYNVVGIPIAAGVLFPIWGIILNPVFAGLAMAGSSVSVVGNALRLQAKKIR